MRIGYDHAMKLRMLVAVGALTLLTALSGCTAGGQTAEPSADPTASAPPSSEAPQPSTSPSATPEGQVIEISLDGVSINGGRTIPYSARADLLDMLRSALGPMAEEPTEPDALGLIVYEWGSVRASMRQEGDIFIWVGTPEVDDVKFTGPDGVAVGWTRDQVIAAGAEDLGFDGDGDGKSDQLVMDAREVPGTKALDDPTRTGREYITIGMKGDVVEYIMSNGNDYNDV